jgi:hypothetical protein
MFDSLPRPLAPLGKIAVALSLLGAVPALAQPFSHADSGWVPIFNGQDFTGIYSRFYGADAPILPTPDPTAWKIPWKILYAGTDTAAIYATTTALSQQGNIGTKKTTYSHYRMRVQAKFDVLNGENNAGITYHTDETKTRFKNNWPRSIEFQLQQRWPGSAFSIQRATFDTRAVSQSNGSRYSENGELVESVCKPDCGSDYHVSNPTISNGSNGVTRWLRYELVLRGSDSAFHIINDTVVFKLWNIRIYKDTENNTPDGPYDHGGIGLQSEGALVKYRRWEIMEFPAGTPKGEHYLHRFFLDNPAKGTASIPGGSTYTLKWRTLGPIPTVNIEYGTSASGAWQSVASGIGNTGTYEWAVPASVTGPVRVRISGPAWAGADSSNTTGSSSIGRESPAPRPFGKSVSFSIEGKGEVLGNIEGASRVEICDVFGRLVRSLAVGGENIVWDRRDTQGAQVQPGIYFLRVLGPGRDRTARSLIF